VSQRDSGYNPAAFFSRPVQEVVVRISRSRPARLVCALVAASLVALATGCSGGSGSSTLPNTNGICDQNAGSISLARPTPGFPQNGNDIEIVASTNTDQLNQFTGQFDLVLQDNFGNQLVTGFLHAVPDPSGPHPYTNDFYYAGTLQGSLVGGRTYNVYLNAPNSSCQPGFVGQIFT
jgi:hypothetical protein